MEKTKAILKVESFSTKDGMLLLSASDYGVRALIKSLVNLCTAKYGGYMRLEMSPPYRSRSLPQNAKWWALCTELGNALGMTKDDVALGIKYRAMEEGLWRYEQMPFAKDGAMKPVSTTTADTQEMSMLMEVLYRVAAEEGVELSAI